MAEEDVPQSVTPAFDLESFQPVLRANHIAYVPAREFSGVPGVGTANLAYVPDFLITAPAWYAGNTRYARPNAFTLANRPAAIVHPKTTLEGVGGVIAGQIVHQPLLAINIDNGNSSLGE